MSRYSVYKPAKNGLWEHLFDVDSVNKEGGAIERLEETITTGPDARIAAVIDNKKNRHVMIFRIGIADRTEIKPLSGGWKEGDADIPKNTVLEAIKNLTENVLSTLAEHPNALSKSTLNDDARIVADESEYAYPEQPDFVVLTWIMEAGFEVTQYVIPRPTEKQLRCLTLANGNFIGLGNSANVDAALQRVNAALASDPEHCEFLIKQNKSFKQWASIWSEFKSDNSTGTLRFEGNTVEFVYCGFIG